VRGALTGPLLALAVAAAGARAVQGPPRVKIINPEPGAVVTTGSVPVVLKAEGIVIAPSSQRLPGTAYFYLFVDQDVTPLDSVIPKRKGIIELSSGHSWYTLEAVTPGPHRLIAVLADPDHVPLHPLASDTVRFTAEKPRR
jgi:hypothetical protein